MVSYILAIVCGILLLGIDQLTKFYIISNFTLGEGHGFVSGLLNIVYIHNRGGAWGVMSGYKWALIILTSVIMAVCVIILRRLWKKDPLMFWALSLVVSGGVGNLIDRIFRGGNVIDFLQFDFWQQFPIFNIADCAIVVGAGLIFLHYVIEMVNDFKGKAKGLKRDNADN